MTESDTFAALQGALATIEQYRGMFADSEAELAIARHERDAALARAAEAEMERDYLASRSDAPLDAIRRVSERLAAAESALAKSRQETIAECAAVCEANACEVLSGDTEGARYLASGIRCGSRECRDRILALTSTERREVSR